MQIAGAAVQPPVVVGILGGIQNPVAVEVFDHEHAGAEFRAVPSESVHLPVLVDIFVPVQDAVAVPILAPVDLVPKVEQGIGGFHFHREAIDEKRA